MLASFIPRCSWRQSKKKPINALYLQDHSLRILSLKLLLSIRLVYVPTPSRIFPHTLTGPSKTHYRRIRVGNMTGWAKYLPLPLTPSGVRNMLSFLPALPNFPLVAKSCHLFLPASSSLFALIFLGTLAGRTGPSLTLLGSRLVC